MNDVIELVTQFINNTGFPIAVCCYMFYSQNKMQDVIERNTNAVVTLCNKLGHDNIIESEEKRHDL